MLLSRYLALAVILSYFYVATLFCECICFDIKSRLTLSGNTCLCLFTGEVHELDDAFLVAVTQAAEEDDMLATDTPGPDHAVPGPSAAGNSPPLLTDMEAANLAFINDKKSYNTKRKQNAIINRFTRWLQTKNETRDISDIPTETVDQLIGFWLIELRKDTGEDYETSTINSYLSSMRSYLKDCGHDLNKMDVASRVSSAKKGT